MYVNGKYVPNSTTATRRAEQRARDAARTITPESASWGRPA